MLTSVAMAWGGGRGEGRVGWLVGGLVYILCGLVGGGVWVRGLGLLDGERMWWGNGLVC